MQQRSTSVLKWREKNDKCIQYMKTGDDKEFKELFCTDKEKNSPQFELVLILFYLKSVPSARSHLLNLYI